MTHARLATAALLVGASALGVAGTSRADRPGAPEALLAVASADPMDYAAVARRVGDGALAQLLRVEEDEHDDAETPSVEVRLAAVRAAPYARAPEHLLASLVELAHGTDPALAPAALASAARVADGLEFHLLEQRESDAEVLDAPAARLRELGDDAEARPDLRQLALHAAARLESVRRVATE